MIPNNADNDRDPIIADEDDFTHSDILDSFERRTRHMNSPQDEDLNPRRDRPGVNDTVNQVTNDDEVTECINAHLMSVDNAYDEHDSA